MIDYSDSIHKEISYLLDKYAEKDPDGIWNEDEWNAYAYEYASANLKKYINKHKNKWFGCKKGELDINYD